MRSLRILSYFLLSFFIIALIAIIFFGFRFYQIINSPLAVKPSPVTIIVSPGMNLPELMLELQERQLLSHPRYFKLWALYKHAYFHLKVGEYLITSKTTPNQLLNNILKGRVYFRKIVFIEGWTFKQMKATLRKNPYIQHKLLNYSDKQIMQIVADKPNLSPEGMFFPNTYEYTWGNSDLLILKTSYRYMQRFLTSHWPERSANVSYDNPYQALIVASMIERETPLNKEKPIIAGIILQRLQKGMRLQIDPTVLYGVGKSYKEIIRHADLWDNNQYNTYRHKGLPPTPISMPSGASILAALHPQDTDYLYFVAKGDGGHTFSKNYHDQLVAVANYRSLSKNNDPSESMSKSLSQPNDIQNAKIKNPNLFSLFCSSLLPSRIFCINLPVIPANSKMIEK
jgi:UPF0755 protein